MINSRHNVWVNSFGDRISHDGTFFDKRGTKVSYSIMIDGVYQKSLGGLNSAKSYVNKKRGSKGKWVGLTE